MVVYILKKDGTDRKAISAYEWTLYADETHGSSIKVFGDVSDYDGGFVLAPETGTKLQWGGCISTITHDGDNDSSSISLEHPVARLMDRSVEWLSTYSTTNIGTLVTAIVTDNFGANQTDSYYRNSWLTCDISASGSCAAPELDDYGFFNAKEFIEDLAECGKLHLMAVPTATGMKLTDSVASDGPTALIDGVNVSVDSEAYSSTMVAKITDHGDTTVTYYLLSDGSITTDGTSANRVSGDWVHTSNIGLEKVAEEFAKNEYEHKIEFSSSAFYRPGQTISIRTLDGRVVSSLISSTVVKHNQDQYGYEAGNLITKLTEVLKRYGK